ncbi:MAG: TlpA family protein disulfide reductase [Alcanivorax sp.]|nr:TlpA family protein disulfide reductase [Alcanivorax sp.]
MQSWQWGPLVVPFTLLPWLAGLLVAWGVARWRCKRAGEHGATDVESTLFMAVLAGILAGRAGFVLRQLEAFDGNLLSMLDIRDGGLWWPAALVGGIAVLLLVPGLRRRAVRHDRAWVAATGLGVALSVMAGLAMQAPERPMLPAVTLERLSGQPAPLSVSAPTVINVWATWCPHCHRSMPAFIAFQAAHPEVRLVMVNQGESAAQVRGYMTRHGLSFDQLLLDPEARLSQALNSRGVPLTLVVSAEGEIVAAHTGGISLARLRELLRALPDTR